MRLTKHCFQFQFRSFPEVILLATLLVTPYVLLRVNYKNNLSYTFHKTTCKIYNDNVIKFGLMMGAMLPLNDSLNYISPCRFMAPALKMPS
jgi:hypothetical protein